jgi:hypothetical protein
MGKQPFSRKIQTRAQSSVYGKIEQLLLAYPGGQANVPEATVIERYKEIFAAFRDRVTFVVLGHFGESPKAREKSESFLRDTMRKSNLDPGKQLIFCHTPLAGSYFLSKGEIHSEFIQDPFLVMESETGAPVLLEPLRQQNPENAYVSEQLALKGDFLIQPCEIEIEGGNILIGDDYALVGKNTLIQNLPLAKSMGADDPKEWVANYLKSILGVRFIIWVGCEHKFDLGDFHNTGTQHFQPFFHLDLFVLLGGKANDGSGKEVVYLADIKYKSFEEATDEDRSFLDKITVELERIKEYLESSGESYPGPLIEVRDLPVSGRIIEKDGERKFYPYSYLNSHVECFQNVKRIYLPSFSTEAGDLWGKLERKLKDSLEFDGFKSVRFIKNDFQTYAKRKGSLHCISKILTRTNW